MNKDQAPSVTHAPANPQCGALAVAPGSVFLIGPPMSGKTWLSADWLSRRLNLQGRENDMPARAAKQSRRHHVAEKAAVGRAVPAPTSPNKEINPSCKSY